VLGHRSASGVVSCGYEAHERACREVDGRWIAEVPELNVVLYGDTKQDAIQRAQSAAREIVLDRIAHGELPPDSANAVFDIAA
jgi:predicted RNase H-like HicB family nuclease